MSSLTLGGAVAVSARTGGATERADGLAEPEVGGAKVVPPLRNTMGFVDDEQRHADGGEPLAEPRLAEPLRRDVGDAGAIFGQPGQRGLLVARRQRRVEPQDLDVELGELVVLIFHERDERRDHERHAVEFQRR